MILNKKVALITGCSRGIGKVITQKFLENGAIVYANARREGSLDELVKLYPNITPLYFDVTDKTAVKNAVMKIINDSKNLDILVNNAGIMKDSLIGMISENEYREVFETNVFAVFELIQIAARVMAKKKSGSIINLASIVANGNKGQLVYSASKGAVVSLTKTAAKELAPSGIRVNAISPGMIDTDLLHSISESMIEERKKSIGFNRLGTPTDIANACLFLASDLSEYITGQILGVDGCEII